MELTELGSILEITKGKKPANKSSQCLGGYLPYVDIEAFETGNVKEYTDGFKCTPCEDGDVLIVCDGSRSGLVGYAIKGYVGSTLAKVSAKGLSNQYLHYFLQGKYALLNTKKKGTGTPHLNPELLKKQKLIAPSFEEQERIVARIEEMFSQLDAGEGTIKSVVSQLALYRQAVLKEAFSQVSFNETRLEKVCDFITKGSTPPKETMHKEEREGRIPFIKVYNLTFTTELDFSIDPTFVDEETHNGFLARSKVYPGDVLMNIVGPPMGKVSIVPKQFPEWNINQAIARFRCHDELDNKYLAYFLSYAKTVQAMKSKAKATAGQFNLTLEICRNISIPLPPISVQKDIVINIETSLSQCEQIERLIHRVLRQSKSMRSSILKEAFEGRLYL